MSCISSYNTVNGKKNTEGVESIAMPVIYIMVQKKRQCGVCNPVLEMW